MNLGQVISVFTYMMAFALLESVLATGALILASLVIPCHGYSRGFAYKGFLTVLVGSFASVDLMNSLTKDYPGVGFLLQKFLVAGGVLLALLVLVHFLKPIQKVLVFLAEQISVMVYFYAPIGILSLLVVLLRNIF